MKECHNCKKSVFCTLKNLDKNCKEFVSCDRVKMYHTFYDEFKNK